MKVVLLLILGFVLGWVATSAAALIYGELTHVSQFEGAYAMGAIFALGPLGGVVGGILGVILALRGRR